WEGRVRLGLVPEGGGGDVVLERQVAGLTVLGHAPAEGLNGDAQVGLEADGVHNVPAVEAEALLALVEAIGLDHLRQAQVGGGEHAILSLGVLEIPGAAKIVFGAGAANGGPIAVA